MRDLILTLFIVGSLPYAFMRPSYGLLMWALLSYMNPHRLTWSYAYDFRFNFLVAFVTLAGVFFNKEVKFRIPIHGTTIFWMFFCLWTVVTSFNSFDPDRAFSEFDRFLKIQLMVLITFFLIKDRKWMDWLIWVIVLSIGVWVMKGGLFTLTSGGNFRVYGPARSFITDNNALALAVLMGLPLTFYIRQFAKRLWQKQLALVLIIFSVITVVGSYSRGGMLGLVVVLGVLFGRSRRGMIVFLLGVVLVALSYTSMPKHWQERMDDFFAISTAYELREDASMMGRLNSWVLAWELAKDRPFVGGGFNTFTAERFQTYAPVPFERHDAHSIYFEVMAEHGFFGFALFIGMHLFAVLLGFKVKHLARGKPELDWAVTLATMLQISLLGYYVAGVFLGLAYFDLPYHLISILVMLHHIVLKHSDKKVVPSATAWQEPTYGMTTWSRKTDYSIFGRSAGQ
ncbi:O-antigen polymerase [Magnetococcus marinus MC-1]|uniref:O-antigen polymerase n=1 Tax=Magnetococcus marinus (strain ATCC BAA-1437 / JCM 17883 / MC-1) TaxID=156889 RepID=A0L560_MAGMM|nr:putative O-glycosylation ligase, exosortase A system-associated [Magnetococcus marinus]ABK43103.1 O-antigen polymerase [Magnetococcus marinus MC-1]